MGREPLTSKATVRLTSREKDILVVLASAGGLTVSSFIRSVLKKSLKME